jgi:DNA-nicking Smr family endonuclease
VKRPQRPVTGEEEALFYDVLRHVRPLPGKRTAIAKPHAAALEQGRRKSAPPEPTLPKRPVHAPSEAPAIGGHREAHMRRGRLEPEARIDLHGLTQDEAHRALVRFFVRARGLDQRVVLVITGKGGVLKSMVPRWLAEADLKPLVAGISPAHIRHGGEGAFYVALRRKPTR